MYSDFGNINDMTKGQFNTAIEYYRNKVKMMNEDTSISERSKAWFLERYEARIKSLETTLENLNVAINNSKNSGVLVNEETITLGRLGASTTATTNFDTLAQNEQRHRTSQRWKIVGACLLPVVGTIPFLISWRRAKKRHKEVASKINQENIELGNFINRERRPYEATLLTSTKFSDAEKANLLEDTTELRRIEALALSGTITPIEKTNLTKKLIEVREFGQKNGYNVTAILTDPSFRTKADKNNIQVTAHETTYNSTLATATNLKDAYDSIRKLENLRAEVQTLYNETKNSRLETLLNNIDSRITTLKNNAKTAINAGVNAIVADVNAVTAASADEAGYTAAINTVEARAVAANANFGTGVNFEQAQKMAEEIGFDTESAEYKKFNEIENARATKKSEFETELNKVKGETQFRTNIADNMNALNNVLTTKLNPLSAVADIDTNINEINIKEAFTYLAEAKSAYDYLESNISSLTAAEKGTFTPLQKEYLDYKAKLEQKNQEFASKAENFDNYKTEINSAIDITKDKDTLSGELELLKSTLAIIESVEYKEKMNKIGLSSELNRLISTAKTKITKYERLITQKETEEENTKHNAEVKDILDENEAILTPILTSISSGTPSTDLIELANYEQQINNVITALSAITGTLDTANKTRLRTLSQSANKSSVAVKRQIQAAKRPEELKAYYQGEIEKIENEVLACISKLNSSRTKAQAINQLSLCSAKLQRLKSAATADHVSLDFDSLLTNISDTITNNPLGPTAP